MDKSLAGDRRMLEEALLMQKELAAHCNAAAGVCSSAALAGAILEVLVQEQQIHRELLEELNRRGWRQEAPADPAALERCRKKFAAVP